MMDLVKLSQELLTAAKAHQPVTRLVSQLAEVDQSVLTKQLKSDDYKKAFWTNLYNAFTQVLLLENPARFSTRNDFFSVKQIRIARRQLSLDDIEHGILRRSKIKWAFGYLDRWFPSTFEKNHRVERLDYRIHFALNCGATSCPPIAFYHPEKITWEFDLATISFLSTSAEYDPVQNLLRLPVLLYWYRFDFGGKKGIMALLEKLALIPPGSHPVVKYKKYNWQLFLENYKTESNG